RGAVGAADDDRSRTSGAGSGAAMVSPAGSRKMLAPWTATRSEEEARAFLQDRLASLFRGMFLSLAGLVAFLWAMYTAYPEIAPVRFRLIVIGSGVALGTMAFIWRALLLRRKLSAQALYRIDLPSPIGIGTAFR